jgi:3-deoxy-D-manno-octulosonic-acid transferase
MIKRKIWSKERLGFLSSEKTKQFQKSIWLHAASVGEVNVLMPLIKEYLSNPEEKLIISTMTLTGQKYLLEKCGKNQDRVYALLLPLDFWPIWLKILISLKPKKIVIAETELWPGFIFTASSLSIPIALVNARISDKSFHSYLKFRFIFSSILRSMSFIYTQSEGDQKRFLEIGCHPQKIRTIGNLKNDGLAHIAKNSYVPIDFFPNSNRVIFGSVRPKELPFMMEAIQKLNELNKDIKVIICTRHFDWLNELYAEFDKNSFVYQISSKEGLAPKQSNSNILIIDQIGYLQRAYQNALSAFVGGTLFPEYGGHNCLEPAALGVPVFHGPHFLEQLANTNALIANGGSKIINSASEFVAEVEKMLLFPAEKKRIAQKCLETVQMESRAMFELKKDNFFEKSI